MTRLKPGTADGAPVEGLFAAVVVVFDLGQTPAAARGLLTARR